MYLHFTGEFTQVRDEWNGVNLFEFKNKIKTRRTTLVGDRLGNPRAWDSHCWWKLPVATTPVHERVPYFLFIGQLKDHLRTLLGENLCKERIRSKSSNWAQQCETIFDIFEEILKPEYNSNNQLYDYLLISPSKYFQEKFLESVTNKAHLNLNW